ncbi:MAG: tRNA-uridine aminocarboxypropyltransferase [Arcobacteraceae bacterium]
MQISREVCYHCYRPKSSCVCEHINPIQTNTQFIILMHPKEYRKTKNTTGHLTHQSLENSHLFIGINFLKHRAIQEILHNETNECFLLYPSNDAIKLNHEKLQSKRNIVIFIIDSTWACSRKILRENTFFKSMKKISFQHNLRSQFHIKTQPHEQCLSTIESTLCVLELLNQQGLENIKQNAIEAFLNPFNSMVTYQLECAKNRVLRTKEQD